MQFGRFLKGIVVGAHYNTGTSTMYCPPPCLGYSFSNQQPVWPLMISDIPVTLSLAIGAAIIWLVGGVAIGVLSALRAGHHLRPASHGGRAGRRVAADLLHRR